ncbi:MAG: CDP-alcohol phosphatidyltransferase family protein [Myxococcales bacterium]|nr:CDP-alcohol phosphatidyltransferase family protein [Myxococcales bacterium]
MPRAGPLSAQIAANRPVPTMVTPALPPFASVLKSRAVEDPINLWLHRPLAYGLVALIYRTPITPNQITLLAMLVGIAAGACWLEGSPTMMVWGGVLLWSSAILDGADGILARAKQLFSELGRSLDGSADAVVAAATVVPAFYHIWVKHHDASYLLLAVPTVVSAVLHIELYDYYKESFLQRTRPDWDGQPERLSEVEARGPALRAQGAPWIHRFATEMYIGLVRGQTRLVRLLDPIGLRGQLSFRVSAETVASYARHNRGPIRLWAMISLAPHSYTMAICGMFDRLELYLWLRLLLGNALFIAVVLWQRRASRRTLAELEALGLAPEPWPAAD